jgi:hypothetical protein
MKQEVHLPFDKSELLHKGFKGWQDLLEFMKNPLKQPLQMAAESTSLQYGSFY